MQPNINPKTTKSSYSLKFKENISSILKWIALFYKRNIKAWSHSIISLLIFSVVGFCFGLVYYKKFQGKFYTDEGQVIFYFSMLVFIMAFAYIYYRYSCRKKGIIHDIDKKSFKYFFYSSGFLGFALYYSLNKKFFLNTYEPNKFGIDQAQYILMLNFLGFLFIMTLVHMLVFKNYSMKKIGKDGIELEEERAVAGEQNNVIKLYIKTIKNFSDLICELDVKMAGMYQENLIIDDYSAYEYTIFLDEFLSSFVSSNPDLSIKVMPLESFEDFARNELSYNLFALSKIKTNTYANQVYSYENRIFVEYCSTIVNSELMIVIDCTQTYPWDLGLLIYSYMAALETCYSKYLV